MGKKKNQKRDLSSAFNSHQSRNKTKDNPFEIRGNKKQKHSVLNRRLKGSNRNVSLSRTLAYEKRKNTLLKEYKASSKSNKFIDNRFGEKNAKLTEEERILERFKKLRTKRNLYDLSDTDGGKKRRLEFTHLGQSLDVNESQDDDMREFEELLRNEGFDENDGYDEKIDAKTLMEQVKLAGNNNDRSKSKKEVMDEVIKKAKLFKMQRQREKDEDETERERLDDEFKDLMKSGAFHIRPTKKEKKAQELQAILQRLENKGDAEKEVKKVEENDSDGDDEYEQTMRSLMFEARSAQATDRTRTPEEIAKRDMEKLAEQQRELEKRMKGVLSDDEDDGDSKKRKRRRVKTDAFFDSNEDVGSSSSEDDDDDDDEGNDEEGLVCNEQEQRTKKPKKKKQSTIERRTALMDEAKGVLPFIIPAPESHVDFVRFLKVYPESSLEVIVERIHKSNSIHLRAENRRKTQSFVEILLEHLFLLVETGGSGKNIAAVMTGLYSIAKDIPQEVGQIFSDRLSRMQATLGVHIGLAAVNEAAGGDYGSKETYVAKPGALYAKKKGGHKGAKGRAQVALEEEEKLEELEILGGGVQVSDMRCWPSASDLAFFRAIEVVFPVSDYRHCVVSPAQLLLSQYLLQCPIRGRRDVAACISTCQLLIDFCKDAKRLAPEVFICLKGLATQLDRGDSSEYDKKLLLLPQLARGDGHKSSHLKWMSKILKQDKDRLDMDVFNYSVNVGKLPQLRNLLLDLCQKAMVLVDESPSCDIMLDGISSTLNRLSEKTEDDGKLKETLNLVESAIDRCQRSRKPVRLLDAKARAIQAIRPLFNENYRWTKEGHDPDKYRVEMKKLKRQVHREQKGVARELRKDAQFLAEKRNEEKQAKFDKLRAVRQRNFDLLQNDHGEINKAVREFGAKGGGSAGADMRGRRRQK